MKRTMRTAFTLIEILIVVVIMAILAATIIPQFTGSTADAQVSTTQFNLNTLRAQIELFKAQHNGVAPAVGLNADGVNVIAELLTTTTDLNGETVGPYLVKMPVQNISTPPSAEVATGGTGPAGNSGWWYNATTGEIRINHPDHYTD